MSEVRTTIEIAAPPAEVWAAALDPDRLGEWVTIHKKLHRHDASPPREGSTMEQSLVIRGAPLKVRWTLVRCEEGTRAEWHGKGPARSKAETEYLFTPIDGGAGTRFDYRNEFTAPLGPLGAVASRTLVGGVPEREAIASLERLKALVEKR